MNLSDLNLDDDVIDFLRKQKDFDIDRVSQEGGNCDIFFGFHRIFDLRIALKIYYTNERSGSHHEPRILSKIEHPNVLRVRDAKRISSIYSYFMTDEIDGGDLEKFHQAGELDLKKSLGIFHGILSGLVELHRESNSIVHRDIKPKNILIRRSDYSPLISDFGSVRHFDIETGCVTGSNTTLIYKPKEVVQHNRFTRQSDIYQLGVTMFQILGGYFPGAYADWLTESQRIKLKQIQGIYDKDIFVTRCIERSILQNSLLRINTLPGFLPIELIKIVKKATHPNLATRYHTAASLMRDLYNIQKSLNNWWQVDRELHAESPLGRRYRIVSAPKGCVQIEKMSSSCKWRKQGDRHTTRQLAIDAIKSLFA